MNLRDLYPEAFEGAEVADDFFELDDESPSSYMRRSLLEGLQQFDPSAVLSPFLDVRLIGTRFHAAELDAKAADVLIKLQNEITAAAPSGVLDDELRIGVGQLSEGSLVMHVRPAAPTVAGGEMHVLPEVLEATVRRVLDLHDTLEQRPQQLPAQTANQRGLHDRVRQLAASLDDADAELELDLLESSGGRRVSRVSERGRSNARALFERVPKVSEVSLAGAVDALDGAGKVRLKVAKTRPEITEVPASIVGQLRIGEYLRLRVRYSRAEDKFGERTDEKWTFVRQLGSDEILPEDSAANARQTS
ncbi:hypothetical protein VZC37_19630 [Gordonia sp. LSe1-13]|uniref:Uncharacterized protein n=1 Tax=Gordonia sesuvii TaxID=3116777 RepID=A0ABU7MHQ8_9ACTN|nr:hypothetical protein [Gordonia sp. LSe1-13]